MSECSGECGPEASAHGRIEASDAQAAPVDIRQPCVQTASTYGHRVGSSRQGEHSGEGSTARHRAIRSHLRRGSTLLHGRRERRRREGRGRAAGGSDEQEASHCFCEISKTKKNEGCQAPVANRSPGACLQLLLEPNTRGTHSALTSRPRHTQAQAGSQPRPPSRTPRARADRRPPT